jgi:hypothetical protein
MRIYLTLGDDVVIATDRWKLTTVNSAPLGDAGFWCYRRVADVTSECLLPAVRAVRLLKKKLRRHITRNYGIAFSAKHNTLDERLIHSSIYAIQGLIPGVASSLAIHTSLQLNNKCQLAKDFCRKGAIAKAMQSCLVRTYVTTLACTS